MADSLVFVSIIILFSLIILSDSTPSIPQADSQTSCGIARRHLISEIQETKLKIARLEFILEETIQDLKAKTLHLRESEKRIEEMASEINSLQVAVSNLKGESLGTNGNLKQLDEEVRLLWATLRRNNFEVYMLESKAQDAEERLKLVASRVEMVADIITEQWIQIQQLEQALHMAEMRAQAVKRQGSFTRCTFLKFIRNRFINYLQKVLGILDQILWGKGSVMCSYMSQAWHQLEKIFLAVKKYHLELQHVIKQEMEKNEFSAALAHKEVVFLLASALITIPAMGAWIMLFSQFS